MESNHDVLSRLVSPVTPESFFSDYYGQAWGVFGEPDRDRFRDLLTFGDLDRVLGVYGLRHPDIRLVSDVRDIAASEYVWKENIIDPMRAARLFAEGATLIFGQLQDRHESLRRLCADLASESTLRTQTNIYLTPPHSQGFDPHWDTHDVFVIQCEGTKHWRIYDGGPLNPDASQKFEPEHHPVGPITAEFTLEAGQVLYIPRGIMHAADATTDVSLHITLGVMAYTWGDFAIELLAELVDRSPDWRQNLPWGFGREGENRLRKMLAKRLQSVAADADVAGVVTERVEAVETNYRPRSTDHLRQAISAASLSDEDVVEKRPSVVSRIEERGDRVLVRAAAREVSFPVTAKRTLETVLQESAVALGSIDDGLDEAGRKTVVSTLIREGVLASRGQAHSHTTEVSDG